MAWLELAPSGIYQISFRFAGQKYKRSTKTADEVCVGKINGILGAALDQDRTKV